MQPNQLTDHRRADARRPLPTPSRKGREVWKAGQAGDSNTVIASAAKQSMQQHERIDGLLRRLRLLAMTVREGAGALTAIGFRRCG